MVSPDYPEIFKRESFLAYGEGVSDWKQLKKAVALWQQRPLSRQQEINLRFYAPLMGIHTEVDKMLKDVGMKITRDKRGRLQARDKSGRFTKIVGGRESHHGRKEGYYSHHKEDRY